jgi:DNA polymerase-3 subunit epsilon
MTNQNVYDRGVDELCYVIIDFETVTPRGRPPEPIEVAAIRIAPGLRLDGSFVFSEFIQPPPGAPVTTFDTRQTGIRPQDVADAPFATEILARLDSAIPPDPYVLVAHNASYEVGILSRFSTYCPRLAAAPAIDTVLLARKLFSELASHTLDAVAHHLGVALPADRHRALPDVQLTADILLKCLAQWRAMRPTAPFSDLARVASARSKGQEPSAQQSLFD